MNAEQTSKKRYVRSWDGFETQRDEVRRLAHEILATDAEARRAYEDSTATGLICAAMRDMSTAPDGVIARAAKAQADLANLTERLVHIHHICLDFVLRESALIMDPSEETRRIYDALLAKKPAIIIESVPNDDWGKSY